VIHLKKFTTTSQLYLLEDVYATIAYYLANREELDTYLKEREKQAEEIQKKLEAIKTPEQKAFDQRIHQLVQNQSPL